jgi:hypothetical protein
MNWKLPFLIAFVSLVTAATAVLVLQFILLNLGVSEAVTNPIALLAGLGAIVLSEWQVRRWWTRNH